MAQHDRRTDTEQGDRANELQGGYDSPIENPTGAANDDTEREVGTLGTKQQRVQETRVDEPGTSTAEEH